jgi:hypothetical protein
MRLASSSSLMPSRSVAEGRDFVRDYRAAFGEPPKLVAAVAVMVDTDNTKSSALACFDAVIIGPSTGQPYPANPPD